MKKPKHSARFRHLILAAATYISGVIILTTWSSIHDKNVLLKQNDARLKETVLTIREILAPHSASAPQLLDAVGTQAYETRIEQMQRFARLTKLTHIGAINPHDFSREISTYGTEQPIPSNLSILINDLPIPRAGTIEMHTVEHLSLGPVRLAMMPGTIGGDDVLFVASKMLANQYIEVVDGTMRNALSGLILIALAFPLVFLSRKLEQQVAHETELLNKQLQRDMKHQKQRELELQDAIKDLERFGAVAAGRESRIIELKEEVNELLEQLNLEKRYTTEKID